MDKVLVFGHKNPDTDSICSAIVKAKLDSLLGKEDRVACRNGEISKETEYALNYSGVEIPKLIDSLEDGQKVILVDHNEFQTSANNIEKAQIIEVIDHHLIANFQTDYPLYYTARPYGCTATILFNEFKQNDLDIDKTTAILMLSAIISDTLLLKSPTCTDKDIEAYNKLEEIAGIDAKEYGMEMLKAGTDLSAYSAEEVITIDAKEFNKGESKFIIAQVNTVDIEDVFSRKEELSFAIEKQINDNNLNAFIFVITDIINTNSKLLVLGNDKSIIEKAFDKKLDEEDSMVLEGVVSRKKQILPPILALL